MSSRIASSIFASSISVTRSLASRMVASGATASRCSVSPSPACVRPSDVPALSGRRAGWGSRTRLLAALAVSVWLVGAGPARAAERSAWGEAGIGLLSVLASAVYGPVKVIYAGAGAITAGFAYALSGGQPDLSQILLARSLRGDYLVTTEILSGERPLVFIGRDPVLEPPLEPQVSEPYPY